MATKVWEEMAKKSIRIESKWNCIR
jgi:hypothetical protein